MVMKNQIKLVALDMDGTLVNHKGKISRQNVLALSKLKEEGKEYVICTGRNYLNAKQAIDEAGLECDLICMNGALACTYEGKIINKHSFTKEDIYKLITLINNKKAIVDIMTGCGSFTTATQAELAEALKKGILLPTGDEDCGISNFQFIDIKDIDNFNHEVFKISALHEKKEVLDSIKDELLEKEAFNIVASAPTNIEITHNSAKKGTVLLEYATSKKIHINQIMTIGDSENDVSMLSFKEGITVAMGNAMEEAKRVARYSTKSNAEDGVAFAIYQYAL